MTSSIVCTEHRDKQGRLLDREFYIDPAETIIVIDPKANIADNFVAVQSSIWIGPYWLRNAGDFYCAVQADGKCTFVVVKDMMFPIRLWFYQHFGWWRRLKKRAYYLWHDMII